MSMTHKAATASFVLVVMLAACNDNHQASLLATAAPLPPVTVTRDDSGLPAGCKVHEVADFISRFFDAFNRGDRAQLTRFFAPSLSWYVVTDAKGSMSVSKRDDLLTYFADRHKHHERLRLLKIRVSGPSWHGGGDIVFLLTRQADDLDGGSQAEPILANGKGAMWCKEQAIFVWAMSTGGGFGDCPEPDKIPANTVIACARS
jgi:hypothetical protein